VLAGGAAPDEVDEVEALRRLTRPTTDKPRARVTVRGVVHRVEVEARPWVLDADDGTTYELVLAAGAPVPRAGARVVVVGQAETGLATTSQVGPVLRVDSLSLAVTGEDDTHG
jgi:hypothetical protein